jgi:RNA-directed DNA polymerase
MKESYGKDPASHPDPESCIGGRKAAGEALTGAHVGQPSSCEIRLSGAPTPLSEAEGNTEGGVIGKPSPGPAQSETLCTRENSTHGKREIPWAPAGGKAGRPEKVYDRTAGMHAPGKSDDRVVPGKPPNKGVPNLPGQAMHRRITCRDSLPDLPGQTCQDRLARTCNASPERSLRSRDHPSRTR